jgi:hypothetical protein
MNPKKYNLRYTLYPSKASTASLHNARKTPSDGKLEVSNHGTAADILATHRGPPSRYVSGNFYLESLPPSIPLAVAQRS